ncbi:MAG: AAA family ATPase [Tepidisphaeraceae bacterium]
MNRVLVLGPCGAGKSMFAARLGAITRLPVIHLDAEYFRPGWIEPTRDQFARKTLSLIAPDRWIIDGNYGATLELRLEAADTIIYLDLPRWLCIARVVKRVFANAGRVRVDMAQGCPERWDWEFMEYVWNFHSESRPRALRRLARFAAGRRVLFLRTRAQVEDFLSHASREFSCD